MSRARTLDAHAVALESLEQRQAHQVALAYNQARQELLDRLISRWNAIVGQREVTPEQAASLLRQSGLLQQIDGRLTQLEQELGLQLRGIVTASSETALTQIRQEIALLPAHLRPANPGMFGQINTQMVERFVPVAFDQMRLATSAMRLQLTTELQTGLIQGQSFDSLARRLFAATTGDNGASPWRRGQLSADLATRRLVITAENGSKQAAIGELQREIQEVRKQVVAVIGPNTTDCCLRAHGQIQPNDKPFTLTGTPRFADEMMYCPFHWNCRSSISMWHPVFERSGLTTANMRKSAEAQLAKGVKSGGA